MQNIKENDPIVGQDLKTPAVYKAIKTLRDQGKVRVLREKKGTVGAIYENVSVSEVNTAEDSF